MKETLEWLNARIGLNHRTGLDRVKKAAQLLGQPDKAYPIIHVTGTNGKGSTVAFLKQLLVNQGLKVGTFTSPHMVTICDRVAINGSPITDADFVRLAAAIAQMEEDLKKDHDSLSYFEILTLLALLYFKEEAVDVCLLEVGIGGLLDATNLVEGDLSLITSIGLDHQDTLGGSLEEIALQKAGIFKSGRPALIGPLPKEAVRVAKEKARALGCPFYAYGQDFRMLAGHHFLSQEAHLSELHLGLPGDFQAENAALALEAFYLFMQEQGRPVKEEAVKAALAETRWAGRLERMGEGIILDGAHNLPAMERLVAYIKTLKGGKISLLFGALGRKDYQPMLAYLEEELPEASLYVTSFAYDGAIGKEDVQGFPSVEFVENYQEFVENFKTPVDKSDLLFVTGSLYFIAEVRAYLLGQMEK